MTSRRNFLKGLALSPALVAMTPKSLMPASAHQATDKSVSLSKLSPATMVSGGICAPCAPFYDFLPSVSSPVRDSLPTIGAKRSS